MFENLSLRPITDADLPLLREIYASTRYDVHSVDWDDAAKQEFLNQQFHAQHTYYQQHFAGAAFDLILADEDPIGRLYVDRREDEHRVIDIALLPQHRGRGIGGWTMRQLLDEAAAAGKKVTIHVEQQNPAMRLYQRLGFQQLSDTGVYFLMEWEPSHSTVNTQD